MMTLPHWFPELDVHPFISIDIVAVRYIYENRTMVISAFRLRALCWKQWRIDCGFNLYKREVR